MDYIVTDIAANEAYNKSTNQIAFDNFIAQASEKNILKYRKGCIKGMFGPYNDLSILGGYNTYYYLLYYLLIQIKLINASVSGIQLYFSLDYAYTIDATKLTFEYLKNKL